VTWWAVLALAALTSVLEAEGHLHLTADLPPTDPVEPEAAIA